MTKPICNDYCPFNTCPECPYQPTTREGEEPGK